MHYHALADLIRNSVLLIALSALYSLLARLRKHSELHSRILIGLVFGCAAIAGMAMSFSPAPGIIFDGRTVVLTMAGLFGGATAAALSALLAGIYRFHAGGAGTWAGLAVIAVSPLIGLTFRRLCKNRPETIGAIALYGLGIITHAAMLACLLLLPHPEAYEMIRRVWLAVLLVLPAATMVCGLLIRNEEQRVLLEKSLWESREDYRITIDSIGDAVIATDQEGFITSINRVACGLTGWKPEEAKQRHLDDIFRIVNEQTRTIVESPVTKVLREGMIVGLANHTVLLSRDGREIPIADSGAPIRDEQSKISGVVLVFRDQTEERDAQRLASARMELIEYGAVHTLEKFLRKAIDVAGTLVDSPLGFYHLVENDQRTICLQQWSTRTDELCTAEINSVHYDIDRAGVWADCLREKKPLIHNDYDSLPHKRGLDKSHPRIIRELTVPVIREGKVAAVLGLGNKPVDYTQRDVETIVSFADSMWEIVERKRAEEARREREDINSAILNQTSEGIVLIDCETQRFAEFNDAACNQLGYSRQEFAQLKLFDIQGSMNQKEFDERARSIMQTGQLRFENRHRRKDGSLRDVVSSNRIVDIHGRTYWIDIWLDITERKQMEEALRENEMRFRTILHTTNEGFWMIEKSGATLDVNPRMCAILGRDLAEVLGRKIFDFLENASKPVFEKIMEQTARGRPGVYEITVCRPDASHAFCRFSVTPFFDACGTHVGPFAMVTDITDLKHNEMQLLRAKAEWERTFDSVPDLVCIVDTSHRIVRANRAMVQRFGIPQQQCIGMLCHQVIHKTALPPEACPLTLLLADGGEHTVEIHDQELGSDLVIKVSPLFDENGVLIGAVHSARDVTEQKALQRQINQSQKMEALGALAGGIAHDFNNILAIIMGYTDIALFDLAQQSPIYAALQNVQKASSRAKDLVAQILAFSRKSERERKPIELRFVVEEALKLLRASIPATIEIRANLDGEGIIAADPTEIQQVVMNLCANASHAMRDKGGLLTVGLDSVYIASEHGLELRGLQPGQHLRLTVSDTGHGIGQELMERIFEPYFTTKAHGEGSGMGLAVVHGIIKGLGGTVEVFSSQGQGATFQIFFPMLDMEIKEADKTFTSELPHGMSERILFVDDEQAIAEIGEMILTQLGYKVTIRSNSLEALELFRREPELFDLIISDQTMPDMTGLELARQVHRLRPDIPVILCTGYSEQLSEKGPNEPPISAVLMKPVSIEQLAPAIRKSLEKASPAQRK
jgi:PAS domain S-box-containing protein